MNDDFTKLIDLASERLGGAVLYANDEFFAPKENLLKNGDAAFIEGKYTDRGKWMDGWETCRRRSPRLDEEFDWCIIRLGLPGKIHGIVVDTAHFLGNFPSHCSLEASSIDGNSDVEQLIGAGTEWHEILPKSPLEGGTRNLFQISHENRVTHLRFKIYPDGGVARLRVHGEAAPHPDAGRNDGVIDLAAVANGGSVPLASDMFFGKPINLLKPGRAPEMSDGWETKRRRGPGHDWCIIELGSAGIIKRVEVDTWRFKGNYPESCSIEAARIEDGTDFQAAEWRELLPNTRLQAHTLHTFIEELRDTGVVTHVRFNIYPDGGVSRLRLYGKPEAAS